MKNGNIILQGWQNYNTNNFSLHPMYYPGLFLKNIQNPCVIDIKQSSSKKKLFAMFKQIYKIFSCRNLRINMMKQNL